MQNSKFLKINMRDLAKGLALAVIVAILQVLLNLLQQKGLALTWNDLQPIIELSIKNGSAYLLKNLFTDSEGKLGGVI